MAAEQSSESHGVEEVLSNGCDCSFQGISVELHGLDDPPAVWASASADSIDPRLMPFPQSQYCESTDFTFVELMMRHLACARSAIVLAPSCGAGKFMSTLLPVLALALKITTDPANLCIHRFGMYQDGSNAGMIHPSVLIIEPTSLNARDTINLLQSHVQAVTMPLIVEGFAQQRTASPELPSAMGNNSHVFVGTPATVSEPNETRKLCISGTRLTFWDSVDQLSIHSIDDVEDLAGVLARNRRCQHIFTSPAQHRTLDRLNELVLRPTDIDSKTQLSTLIDRGHHDNEDSICEWERSTTFSHATNGGQTPFVTAPSTPTTPSPLPDPPVPPLTTTTATASPSWSHGPTTTTSSAATQSTNCSGGSQRSLMDFAAEVRDRILYYSVAADDTIELASLRNWEGIPIPGTARIPGRVSIRKSAVSWLGELHEPNKFALAQVNKEMDVQQGVAHHLHAQYILVRQCLGYEYIPQRNPRQTSARAAPSSAGCLWMGFRRGGVRSDVTFRVASSEPGVHWLQQSLRRIRDSR